MKYRIRKKKMKRATRTLKDLVLKLMHKAIKDKTIELLPREKKLIEYLNKNPNFSMPIYISPETIERGCAVMNLEYAARFPEAGN